MGNHFLMPRLNTSKEIGQSLPKITVTTETEREGERERNIYLNLEKEETNTIWNGMN